MQKIKAGKMERDSRVCGGGGCRSVLNWIVRESLTKKAFEQRLEGGKRGVMKISEKRGF